MKIHPFRDGDASATLHNLVRQVTQEIRSLDNEYVLKASETELEYYYVSKATIQPLSLHADQYYIESQNGTQMDVSNDFRRGVFPGERAITQGTCLNIAIPYEGDATFWRLRPSSASMSGYPEIEVHDDRVILSFTFPDDTADSVNLKSGIDRNIKSLVEAVQSLHRDIESHNKSTPQEITSAIKRKRELAESTLGAVTGLGIPIKRRDKPLTFIVPTKRRIPPTKRPKVSNEAYQPGDPILDETEYQHILEVMRSMSMVIERNPGAFVSLDEEAIRTHFLLQLNGHYEGCATGETFNAVGKTDILIRVENRNIFIAECKFWRGQKAFDEAIDQLLGYLSWRDSKCAVLIFNKTKDSMSVRQKMHEAMEARLEHRKTITHTPTGDSRYVFVKETDPGREIIITTQLYDIPVVVSEKDG